MEKDFCKQEKVGVTTFCALLVVYIPLTDEEGKWYGIIREDAAAAATTPDKHEEEQGEQRQWRRSCFFFFFFFEGGIVGGTDKEASGKSFCSCCLLLLLLAFMGPAPAKKLMQRHVHSCRRCQLASVALLLQLHPSSLSFSFLFLFGCSVSQVLVCIGSRLQAASMAGWLAGWCHGAGPHGQQQWGSCKPWTIWSRSAVGQCGMHHTVWEFCGELCYFVVVSRCCCNYWGVVWSCSCWISGTVVWWTLLLLLLLLEWWAARGCYWSWSWARFFCSWVA